MSVRIDQQTKVFGHCARDKDKYEVKLTYVITYGRRFLVHVLSLNVPRHPEICHFTRQIFTQQDISSCQVAMNNL